MPESSGSLSAACAVAKKAKLSASVAAEIFLRLMRVMSFSEIPQLTVGTRRVAIVLFADVFRESHVGPPLPHALRRPGLGERARIVDGELDLERVVHLPDALDEVHLVGVKRAGLVDLRLLREADGVDHERVAFPVPDGVAE